MTTEIDYYELLEVERTADASVLKSAALVRLSCRPRGCLRGGSATQSH